MFCTHIWVVRHYRNGQKIYYDCSSISGALVWAFKQFTHRFTNLFDIQVRQIQKKIK